MDPYRSLELDENDCAIAPRTILAYRDEADLMPVRLGLGLEIWVWGQGQSEGNEEKGRGMAGSGLWLGSESRVM